MEQNRRVWNTLETTVSYKAWARLTPTLTHVVTYELVTSGAEDRAMSFHALLSEREAIITAVRGLMRPSRKRRLETQVIEDAEVED